MKGIEVWIWIIAGIVVAFIMFSVFVQLMGFVTKSRETEDAKRTFGTLSTEVDSLCDSPIGQSTKSTFTFPESVSVVYSAPDPAKYYEIGNRTYGNFVCINIANDTTCQQVRCKVEFDPVKNSENILSLVDTILGQPHYQDYQLSLTKSLCGVSVLRSGESPTDFCP